GDPVPARLGALLDAEGVDVALLFAEYSPGATGVQPVEDLLPVIAHSPGRFRLVANVNPAVHPCPAAEAERQLDLGAVAVSLHEDVLAGVLSGNAARVYLRAPGGT